MCRPCTFITILCVALVVSLLIFVTVKLETVGVEVTVQDATLRRFDVDPTHGVLYFNLTADVRIYNPNEVDVHSDHIRSALYYNGYNLKYLWLAPLTIHLHGKETAVVAAAFAGRADGLDSSSCPTRISYSFDLWMSPYFRPNSTKWYRSDAQDMLKCELDLRLVANETLKTVNTFYCGSVSAKYWPADFNFQ